MRAVIALAAAGTGVDALTRKALFGEATAVAAGSARIDGGQIISATRD